MSLFVDLIAAGESRTNQALEVLCKAHGDDDGLIWEPHYSPFVSRVIELFTQRGLMRLDGVRKDLDSWMAGAKHRPGIAPPERPDGAMIRWTPQELGLVKLYLESLPPEQWTLEDHMLMVDFVVQKHMPASDLRSEAQWLASRAAIMGKVQANLHAISEGDADKILQALPGHVRDVEVLMPGQRKVMEFAANRAAEHVTSLADTARHQMRSIIARHVEARELGTPQPHSLQTELLDTFGTLNRDWRRIAVTEAGEAQAQGFVAAQPPGTKIKRFEHYKNACTFCRRIDGQVYTVVAADAPDKDGWTQVWVGKTNVGRSASPRKRQGDILVAREESEMWWPAAGTQHPHCRGTWLPVIQDQPGDDPEFGDWLRATLGSKD